MLVKMSTRQDFQHLQFSEFVSERISKVGKRSRFASVLLICFAVLLIFKVKNSSTTQNILLSSSRTAKPLDRTSQNTTVEKSISHQNSTASVPVCNCEKNSNASNSADTSSKKPDMSQAHSLFAELHSGFVRDSCLSRFQSYSYRKSQPYNPSPYLISKLRDYQKLHARCGPHSSSYRQFIRRVSRSGNKKVTSPCKYLVWTPANGLGNRMVSVTAAFLYSLLESRVLLVEFETDMIGLFCEPFPKSTWLLPKTFPYKNHWSSLPSFENRANLSNEGISSSIVHLQIQHGNGDSLLRQFHCSDTQILLRKIPVLILLSDQYFVPSLFMSPIFNSELNRMFPKKGAIFHLLSHYLFNPSNEAWGLITRFYQPYLAILDQRIGLQIRAFTPKTEIMPYENIMSQILNCTLDNNILPPVSSNTSLNFASQNHTSNSKAVLVASLYPEFSERLRNMYLSRPTVTGEVVGVYQPSHEENQKFNDNMHNMKAWVEIYLLSLCDVLVTSGRSTFGYVAQGLGGLNSWIMETIDGSKARYPVCKRGISSEPCLHVPPTYDCSGKNKIENITAVNSNLNICEDVGWGIKLFDQ